MNRVKRGLLRGLTHRYAARAVSRLTGELGVVFMMHRFSDAPRPDYTSVELLRTCLRFLRDERIEAVTLAELCRRRDAGESPTRLVVFTIDDGYHDFYAHAAPVFEEFGVPATVFLTTGFLDGDLWQWWDRVAWAVEETECRSLTLELDGRPEVYRWDSRGEAIAVADRLAYRLKEVDESVRLRTLELLEEKLAVTIPVSAPEAYAPMSWEQVRGLAARGFEFSPHTVTHPILTRVDREQAKREIEESRARCEAELGWQPRTFCYPDGSAEAFSEREAAIVQELGFKGAVTALHGYVPMSEEVDPFRLRRFPFPFHLSDFIQIVSGLEHLKMKLRGAR